MKAATKATRRAATTRNMSLVLETIKGYVDPLRAKEIDGQRIFALTNPDLVDEGGVFADVELTAGEIRGAVKLLLADGDLVEGPMERQGYGRGADLKTVTLPSETALQEARRLIRVKRLDDAKVKKMPQTRAAAILSLEATLLITQQNIAIVKATDSVATLDTFSNTYGEHSQKTIRDNLAAFTEREKELTKS